MTTPRHIGLSWTPDSYRAMLDGRKTQTRRVIAIGNSTVLGYRADRKWWARHDFDRARAPRGFSDESGAYCFCYLHVPCAEEGGDVIEGVANRVRSKIEPGDLLYWSNEPVEFAGVGPRRQQIGILRSLFDGITGHVKIPTRVKCPSPGRWHGLHLPVEWARPERWEVMSVRAERLQDISEADATAEGVDGIPAAPAALSHRTSFAGLWDSINARRGHPWSKNEWVWVLEYKEHKG